MNNTQWLNFILQPAVLVAAIGLIAGAIRYFVIKRNAQQSINKALLSEISRLLKVLVRHKKWWDGCIKDGNTDLPLINFSTDVYNTLLKSWGEVNPSYAGNAVRFYGYVKFLNRLQATRVDHTNLKRSDEKPNGMKIFADTYQNALGELERDFKDKFTQAFAHFKVEPPFKLE